MFADVRRKTYELLDAVWFRIIIYALIIVATITVILESEPTLWEPYQSYFQAFEIFTIIIFTIEYLARIWTCVEIPKYSRPLTGRLRYAVSLLALVDLIAILPFYIPLLTLDLRFMRVMRLFRMLRILKLGRYSKSLKTIGNVFKNKKEELSITVFSIFVLWIIAACLMYLAENDAQPDVFSSIPATMWWAIITITTVGYGDIYPITVVGKIIASGIALLGIGLFALPAGILGAGFVGEMEKKRAAINVCPHCGKEIKK